MKTFLDVMKALSDKNRVKIIKMLQIRELCVCEIQSGLNLAQSTVSKNLKILENAGLVISRKQGLWVNYSINPAPDNPYASTILGNLRYWLDDDPEIKAILKQVPALDRDTICGSN